MKEEIYSPEEELLIAGTIEMDRRKFNNNLLLLLDYEMGKLMDQMEQEVGADGE